MKYGRHICDTLKKVRLDIAQANGIEYHPTPCDHDGECLGTCPACESEVMFLEKEIARKRSIGKAALIAGVSLGVTGLSAVAANSSSAPSTPVHSIQACDSTQHHEEIFGACQMQSPSFRGGERALLKFLEDNIVYPPEAIEQKIEGIVIVQFVVCKDGTVSQAKIARGVHPLLDNEALRLVGLLPKFFPGKQGGKAIEVWYTMPIKFSLHDKLEDAK